MKKKGVLAVERPDLLKEWDYKKNDLICSPNEITIGSSKIVWWMCDKGHSWRASIHTRNKGHNCPYCANQKVLPGFNDLASVAPSLLNEWDYDDNVILPSEITVGSGKKVWWKCSFCGNKYKASPSEKKKNRLCPNCSSSQTSLSEQIVFYYIKKSFPSAERRSKKYGFELDVYIPELNYAVEYDGVFYHKNKRGITDDKKDLLCKQNGIKLIRIREHGLEKTNNAINIFRNNNTDEDLEKCIEKVLLILGKREKIHIKKDIDSIISNYYRVKEKESLKHNYPELCNEWDFKRNGKLDPSMISAHSNLIVWWKCAKGHEWRTTVKSRANGSGCPICLNQKVLKGYNDFLTLYPEIAKEWDYSKNAVLPDSIVGKSGKQVWWKCKKCGHEWKSTVYNRCKGVGCPKCANAIRNHTKSINRIANGEKSFEEEYPQIATEWDHSKNTLLPSEITSGSSRKVWWKCSEGHQWQASVVGRRDGDGCPYCGNKRLLRGYNDLQTVYPKLAKEWSMDKNNLHPYEVLSGTNQAIWWKCNKGHEWQAQVSSRVQGRGCPYCANKKVMPGYNDFATTNPELAKEWNLIKNGVLKVSQFTKGSGAKVWWKCKKCGHEWQATITNRTKGKGCPICAKKKRQK